MWGQRSWMAKNSSPTLITPTGRPSTSMIRQPSRRTPSTSPIRCFMPSTPCCPIVMPNDLLCMTLAARRRHRNGLPAQEPPMSELLDAPGTEGTAPSRYDLVDCDVHPIMKGGMRDLRPYLSRAAQRRLGLDERRSLTTVGHR